jgi:hypothetical protein
MNTVTHQIPGTLREIVSIRYIVEEYKHKAWITAVGPYISQEGGVNAMASLIRRKKPGQRYRLKRIEELAFYMPE